MSELTEEEKRIEGEVQAALRKLQTEEAASVAKVHSYWGKYGADVAIGAVLFLLGIALGHFTA